MDLDIEFKIFERAARKLSPNIKSKDIRRLYAFHNGPEFELLFFIVKEACERKHLN